MKPHYFGTFSELGIGQVTPRGWIRELLERQRDGLGRNHAVSGYPYDTRLWTTKIPSLNPKGKGWWPYEQTGYLVDGLLRLGRLVGDDYLAKLGHKNIAYVLARPHPNGALGPRHIGPTQWPNAVFFRAMMAEYSATRDPRILKAMQRHFRSLPKDFGHDRNVCLAEAMCWLYFQTGDRKTLEIAKRAYATFEAKRPRTCTVNLVCDHAMDEHGVSFNEMVKIPVLLYLATGERAYLEPALHAYRKVDRYHMTASGLHSARERLESRSSRELHETCCVTDYTWSLGYLLMATGDADWADHIEKAVFNAGLGSITKDFKAHQYFSSPNQMIATSTSSWETFHHKSRCAYKPGHEVECCTGNVHRFLPNYASRMWMKTSDGGLAATLYGPCEVSHDGIWIVESTNYPFSDEILFHVHVTKPRRFPLHLRIPKWCDASEILVNGRPLRAKPKPGSFEVIERTFSDGDLITLRLPAHITAHTWPRRGLSLERGPLVFSLPVESTTRRSRVAPKQSRELPAWEMTPKSAWNFGLPVEPAVKARLKRVKTNGFPWEVSPVEISVPARSIPNWKLPADGTVPDLPERPKAAKARKRIRLIPYGATTLRVTVFPTAT